MSLENPGSARKEKASSAEGELAYVAGGLKAKTVERGLENELERLTSAANDDELGIVPDEGLHDEVQRIMNERRKAA